MGEMWSRSLAFVAIMSVAAPAAAQDEAQMEEDAESIHALYQQLRELPDFRLDGGVGRRIGENRQAYVQARERLEQLRRIQEQHAAFLQTVRERYAPGQEPWQFAGTLNRRFEELGLGYDTGDELQSIVERLELLENGPRELAMACLQQLEDTGVNQTLIRDLHEFYKLEAIREARTLLDVCPRMAPGDARIERRVARLRPRVEETLAVFEEEERRLLASRDWNGGVGSLSSGNPQQLAQVGLRFLRGLPDWGGNRERGTQVLVVSITRDWFPAERNLLGQVTKWALGVNVAVRDNTTRDEVVNVYDISLVTTGPEKNGSFGGVWVGESWRLLRAKLPR